MIEHFERAKMRLGPCFLVHGKDNDSETAVLAHTHIGQQASIWNLKLDMAKVMAAVSKMDKDVGATNPVYESNLPTGQAKNKE